MTAFVERGWPLRRSGTLQQARYRRDAGEIYGRYTGDISRHLAAGGLGEREVQVLEKVAW